MDEACATENVIRSVMIRASPRLLSLLTRSAMAVRIVRLKDVLEPGEVGVLVDRLWPRGGRKRVLAGIRWMPEVAPSAALERRYGHDSTR